MHLQFSMPTHRLEVGKATWMGLGILCADRDAPGGREVMRTR
jgi:hypothetical protein